MAVQYVGFKWDQIFKWDQEPKWNQDMVWKHLVKWVKCDGYFPVKWLQVELFSYYVLNSMWMWEWEGVITYFTHIAIYLERDCLPSSTLFFSSFLSFYLPSLHPSFLPSLLSSFPPFFPSSFHFSFPPSFLPSPLHFVSPPSLPPSLPQSSLLSFLAIKMPLQKRRIMLLP